jgi:hypothetical protein
VHIAIVRPVRLTVWGSDILALERGEIYDVAPAVGRVLVAEGWAIELNPDSRGTWIDTAADGADGEEPPGSISAS